MLKLREGGYYRRRDGQVRGPVKANKHLINTGSLYPFRIGDIPYTENGSCYLNSTHEYDLVNEVKVEDIKPIEHVRYFNIYHKGIVSWTYSTRSEADKYASAARIGCKRVVFMEGEWDE